MFTTYYYHVKVHQDDQASFNNLSRKVQLNCICDHAAKQRIAADGIKKSTPGRMFPLEPICLFVQDKKMTSKTGNHICYWAHHHLAQRYDCNHKLLSFEQFDAVDWKSIHRTLHKLPQLFQLWAAKHGLGMAGIMKFLSQQDGSSPLCPSCNDCNDTCRHIARCPEVGRAAAFAQSTHEIEAWLDANRTP
jgi:hypothetical protein